MEEWKKNAANIMLQRNINPGSMAKFINSAVAGLICYSFIYLSAYHIYMASQLPNGDSGDFYLIVGIQ